MMPSDLPHGNQPEYVKIRDGHRFIIPQAIRAVDRGKYDLMILTEMNILDVVYCRNHLGYDVVCSR